MTEEHRQRTIWRKLSRSEEVPTGSAIPTGLGALDRALGAGGLPRGRIVEWFGPPSCGKTSLALETVAHAQRNGSVAAWIDADRTFDPAYAAARGITLDRLPVVQADSAEQTLEIAGQLLASGAVDLLVVDSAAALTPRLELDGGLGDGGWGLQRRVLESGLRRLSFALRRNHAAAVFLNQTRWRLDGPDREMETSAGGPALKLYAAARIGLQPAAASRVRFRILKNKAAAPFACGELVWRGAGGFAESP